MRGWIGFEESEGRGLLLSCEGRDVMIMLCGRGFGATVAGVVLVGAMERRLLADMLGRELVLSRTVVVRRRVVDGAAAGGRPLTDLLIRLSRALLAFV